jgi:hypothetical protein
MIKEPATERRLALHTRRWSVSVGAILCTSGIYALDTIEKGTGRATAALITTAVGACAVVCPVISEIQDRIRIRQVSNEAEVYLRSQFPTKEE